MRVYPFFVVGLLCCQLTLVQGQTYLDTAVNFVVEDIDGNTHELFDYLEDGKYVVIDFFFTTCNPCIGSVPILNEAYQQYGCNTEDIFFLGINYGESNFDLFNYTQDYGYLLPAASGWQGGANEVIYDYGIYAFPTVILIAPDKSIINQDIFPVTSYNLNHALQDQAGLQPSPNGCLTVPTSTVELTTENGLSSLNLFPNPVQGREVTLQSTFSTATDLELRIFNTQGQQLGAPQQLHLHAGLQSKQLHLPELTAGLYLLQFYSEEGQLRSLPLTVLPE
ncbi:MAG: redoxin domain-containing protein [Phaeodactylibacter sp.]|nr:redoxin domain-containing protein [Phaeodactylibacter sp.]